MAIQVGALEIDIAGLAASTGVFVSMANPEGVPVFITRVILNVTTKSTGASTVDIGVHATSPTTSDDRLLDGKDVGTAVGTFDNIVDHGTNGLGGLLWPTAGYLNVKEATGDVAGLVGKLYIKYQRLE